MMFASVFQALFRQFQTMFLTRENLPVVTFAGGVGQYPGNFPFAQLLKPAQITQLLTSSIQSSCLLRVFEGFQTGRFSGRAPVLGKLRASYLRAPGARQAPRTCDHPQHHQQKQQVFE